MVEDDRILSRRNVYNSFKKRFVKDHYTRIAFLESSGTQLIDTGIHWTPGLRVEIECLLMESPTYPVSLFGFRGDSNGNSSFCQYQWSNQIRDDYGNFDSNNPVYWNHPTFARLLIKKSNNETWMNGERFSYDAEELSIEETFHLFGMSSTNEPNVGRSYMKLYTCKMYDGEQLIRDFIPVEIDGVGYLYDRIESKIYENVGTGAFRLGPSIELPEEYERLLYIQSQSISKNIGTYIDTGMYPTNNTVTVVDFQFVKMDTESNRTYAVFGSRNNNQTINYNFVKKNNTSSSFNWRLDVGNSKISFPLANYFCRNRISLYKKYLMFENGINATANDSVYNATDRIFLFAMNNGMGTLGSCTDMKIYRFELYYENMMDFTNRMYLIPARRISDGKVGMYDAYSGEFLINEYTSGTNKIDFIAGPTIDVDGNAISDIKELTYPDRLANMDYVSSLLKFNSNELSNRVVNARGIAKIYRAFLNYQKPYTQIEYIQGTGTQWFDTRIVPNETTVMDIVFESQEATGIVVIGFFEDQDDGP